MPSGAVQMKKNDQAAVVSMVARLLYCRRPSWAANSCALSMASADLSGGRAARGAHQASPRMARSARVAHMASLGVVASF